MAQKCENCHKRPSFNTKGSTKGRFCADHKEPGMVNVTHKTCDNCDKIPTFNTKGSTKGRFCADHKEPGMVNVVSKTCENCDKQPIFNTKGSAKGRFCADHKEPGMVNVMNKTCENCDKQPTFNTKGSTKGRFCADHKEPGMVNVKDKTCENCDRRAFYGFAGKPPKFCYEHREINTILKPTKKCLEQGCKEVAIFGIKNHEHCETHKIKGEINIVERKCVSCGLLGLLDKNEHCQVCDPDAFRVVRLAKQNMVVDYLISNGIRLSKEQLDRAIHNGVCGKERPDIWIDCGTHILVIEVDEHQHSDRPCECEQTRMVNVSQSNGMDTIFLRFNPDTYKPKTKGHNMISTSSRLKHLLDWVNYHIDHAPKDFLSVMYLYFDGFEKGSEKLETILAKENDVVC